MPQWATIDKQETEKIIKAVKDSGEPSLFSAATSEGKCAKLPFYRNVLLYRITNYASLPAFSFDYLGKDKHFYYLDGSFEPLFGVNKSENFVLSADTVTDYVAFYFHYVRNEDGDIKLLHDTHSHAGLDSLPEEQVDAMNRQNWDVHVSLEDDIYILSAILDNAGSLVRATITVDKAGRVTITDQQMMSADDQYAGAGA